MQIIQSVKPEVTGARMAEADLLFFKENKCKHVLKYFHLQKFYGFIFEEIALISLIVVMVRAGIFIAQCVRAQKYISLLT